MLDCAKLAHERGLRNVYHSNGFIRPEPLRELCKYLDAANIDLKGFTEEYYEDMSDASLAPVLRSLKILSDEGVHLEVTTLLIPGRNDDPETLTAMCRWIKENLGPDVPLHFSRFNPMYRLRNLPPTPLRTLQRAHQIARDAGVHYVYIGNVPMNPANHTYCHKCGKRVIKRLGFLVRENRLLDGRCPDCGAKIDGVWFTGD